ncbi:MAG: aminotransferase class V-fold PLP-dependent enzyme [Candidatus Aenigmatarchaeota archaeon]
MNTKNIIADFPSLNQKIRGKPVIYLDSACTTLRPKQVIDTMDEYYEKYPACAGRSVHAFGAEVTEKYNNARDTIAKFINAKRSGEIIFTRNTTEGINLVANSLNLAKGDIVLTTDKEHNSNLLPWQLLSKRRGIRHEIVFSNTDMTFNMENFENTMDDNVKLVSMVHTSNLDGYTIPAEKIIKLAHDHGALVMLDCAQSVPHKSIDVKKMDVDFIAFSGHKMLGPSGMGVLYGKYDLLEKMDPFMIGGDTVKNSTYDSFTLLDPPEKFEAGLQNYAGAIGFAAAAEYLRKVGMKNISSHELEINEIIYEGIKGINGSSIIGPSDSELRGGITSFNISGMDFHDIAVMLNESANIMVRSGQHCVHSWFNAHKIKGCVRSSLYLYNTKDDARVLVENLEKISRLAK